MKEKQTHSIPLESTCKITDEICLPDTKLPRVVIVGGGFAGLALVEKYLNDPLVLIVAAIGIVLILVAERLFMISHTDDEGNMPMGMETTNNKT